MDDIFLCARIGVDCVENDFDNIKQGEPKYLGFVFDVKKEEAEDMIEFIEESLNKYQVPYQDIYVYCSLSLPAVKIWSKEKIMATIEKDANYFIKKSHSRSK